MGRECLDSRKRAREKWNTNWEKGEGRGGKGRGEEDESGRKAREKRHLVNGGKRGKSGKCTA